ncbi:MAG: cob(I)yrinic acid a,c-diamide adenosyltransferase [Lachnospiraceae bacterium]
MKEKGLVHIYCGNGKGKTTAAVGLAVRCAGGGGKVLFYQFLKDGNSGEINILKNIPEIDVMETVDSAKFVFQMTPQEKSDMALLCRNKLEEISEILKNDEYDMLILDEVLHVVNFNFISPKDMLTFIKDKPEKLELVLTGYEPSEELTEAADYVSDICKVKHPFDKGIGARKLIEM